MNMSVFSRFQPAERAYFEKLRAQGATRFASDPLVEGWQLRDGIWSRYHQLRAKEEQKEKKEGAPA